MPANTKPIFTAQPDVGYVKGINQSFSGMSITGPANSTTIRLLYYVGADGAYIQKIRWRSLGSNIASVGRIWVCTNPSANGSTVGSANTFLYEDVSLPATSLLTNAAQTNIEVPMNLALPPNYGIVITLGTAISAGYDVSVIAGTYTA